MSNVTLNQAPPRLSGVLITGDGATFTATSDSGDWPASTALKVENASGVEQSFAADVAGTLATWTLTVAQVTALIGTARGSLAARITIGTGDSLRSVAGGRLSILSKWVGLGSQQSLGTVTLGPHGPGVASAAIVDGALVLTLDNSETLDPVSLPMTATLAEDGTAPGLYHMGVGTTYALTLNDDDLYNMTPLTTTLGVI